MGLLRSIAARFPRFGSSASTSTNPQHLLGRRGEQLAAQALRKEGYKVLYRNFRPETFSLEGGEIDLVCRDGEVLVFVEVKTRHSIDYGTPLETVTTPQRQRIIAGALAWLRMLGYPAILFRFDVVEIVIQSDAVSLGVVKDAFTLPDHFRYPATPPVRPC